MPSLFDQTPMLTKTKTLLLTNYATAKPRTTRRYTPVSSMCNVNKPSTKSFLTSSRCEISRFQQSLKSVVTMAKAVTLVCNYILISFLPGNKINKINSTGAHLLGSLNRDIKLLELHHRNTSISCLDAVFFIKKRLLANSPDQT